MFKWAASVSTKFASSLSETFAPLFRTHLEQLQDAWKKVEQDCKTIVLDQSNAENMDDPQRLVESELVNHLNQLVEALVKEEEAQADDLNARGEDSSSSNPYDTSTKESSKSSTGPCFEYFLNEKILDRLCALGLPDRPLGMRQLITKTLDAVLLNTRHPILPSMSVHMAVRQFLEVCYSKEDHKRRGYRSAFLSLLCTISKKIKADPSLAGIFFDYYPAKENRPPEFLLFTALCAMMSESATEGRLAYESLLWLAQLPNPSITEFILQHSIYLPKTVDSLVHLFRVLPPPHECAMVEELLAAGSFPTVDNFFKRWCYCDTLMRSTYIPMQVSLGVLIREKFLDGVIAPLLLDQREAVATWTTNFIKHLALSTEAPALRKLLVEFLLGADATTPEQPPSTTETGGVGGEDVSPAAAAAVPGTPNSAATSSTSDLRSILLKRLDSLSDILCLHTLDLFSTLLGLRDPLIIQNLVLRNVPAAAVTSGSAHQQQDVLPIQQSFMFSNFTDLPDFASTANFEDYLLDAQLEGQLWMQAWEEELKPPTTTQTGSDPLASPVPSPSPSSSTTTATTTAPFYEGLFLATLCNKLESLYENSFATNLKLSSVLSKLSYCPQPALHDFLFNPDYRVVPVSGIPVADASSSSASSVDDQRLILHVLASVWNKGVKRATRMQNFARRKEEAKQRLNAQISTNSIQNATNSGSVETMDGERFFRGLILLEELLKEFYAIGHTKARLFALQKLARLQATQTNNSQARTTSVRESVEGIEPDTDALSPAAADSLP